MLERALSTLRAAVVCEEVTTHGLIRTLATARTCGGKGGYCYIHALLPPSFFLLFLRATGQFYFKQVNGSQEADIIANGFDVALLVNLTYLHCDGIVRRDERRDKSP